ncbi:MAG: hypothetical protein R3B70_05155 [Polyangiaceae bacterium]
MTSHELWVAVATTDRPEPFAALVDDIAHLAASAGAPVRLFVVENSARSENRHRTARTLEAARARGIRVTPAESPGGGESIAQSRLRQRELIRQALRKHGALSSYGTDDDVRLGHLIWTGHALRLVQLHNHFELLRAFASRRPDVDMLIGEVTGDPPIPPLATMATRLTDLRWNLARLFAADPAAHWHVPDETLSLLREQDAYYDLSLERPRPAWESPSTWLPRREGATVSDVCGELLDEVHRIPFGVGFTRPIVTTEARLSRLGQGARRGANAVFFDPELCLAHPYPVAVVSGFETRRSDMIGSSLLHRLRRPSQVVSIGFSVLHTRPSQDKWPSPDDMRRLVRRHAGRSARPRGLRAPVSRRSRGRLSGRTNAPDPPGVGGHARGSHGRPRSDEPRASVAHPVTA